MTGGAGSPIRSASLSVEDDKGGSRLRMTKGLSVEDDKGVE